MRFTIDILNWVRKQPRWALSAALLAIIGACILFFSWGNPDEYNGTTFSVRRGPLTISVLQGGNLEALETQEIRSEIKGSTKILSIVEEGYLVTDQDVDEDKVLVELDSSELRDRITTQEITFQSTMASLTEAMEEREIQTSQNVSDITSAEQKARFARLDFEKFMGAEAATQIIDTVELDALLQQATMKEITVMTMIDEPQQPTTPPLAGLLEVVRDPDKVPILKSTFPQKQASSESPESASKEKVATLDPGATQEERAETMEMQDDIADRIAKFNYKAFTDKEKMELLGDGEAKQKLRKFLEDLRVAQNELLIAEEQLAGTRRLEAKGFVTKNELQKEDLAVQKSQLKVETAETGLALFKRYDFAKSAEEFLSKYEEALRLLLRTRRETVAQMAQANAKLSSAKRRYNIEKDQLDELSEQLEKCVIRAEKTGLVVYGGSNSRRYYSREEQIREGATVHERQSIITIPDMKNMGVNVKIHESYIKKINKGMPAKIVVEAAPDKPLLGHIDKVAVLPDSENRWLNPDLRVYVTKLTIDGVHDWLKPGMSAEVEIIVKELEDVVYVPLQAVHPDVEGHICFVAGGSEAEHRKVEIGEFNDEFIVVLNGLQAGENVYLSEPPGYQAPEPGYEPEPDIAPAKAAAQTALAR